MKYLFILALLAIGLNSNAQLFKAGAIAGANLTQVDGDELYGYKKAGFNGGLMVILPLESSKRLTLSIETIFNQKGSYQKHVNYFHDSLDGFYKLVLDYAEIPVLLHFKDKDFLNFGTGLSYGRLVRFGEWTASKKVDWSREEWPYTEWDLNWIADIDFPISQRFHKLRFNFRYCYSIVKLRDKIFNNPFTNEAWKREQYNNILTFRLQYIFNEPKRQLLEPTY